jgi:hypothetical protein
MLSNDISHRAFVAIPYSRLRNVSRQGIHSSFDFGYSKLAHCAYV